MIKTTDETASELKGLNIMVVEDEYFLADDFHRMLSQAGARVAGPFSNAKLALDAADREAPDCAIVDINLGHGPQFVVARALHQKGVPVIFATGYDPATVPEDLRDCPCLTKPTDRRQLISTVAAAVRPARR